MARIGLREGETEEEARAKTIDRQRSEAKRYKMYYDIDIEDLSVYDLVVNTDELDPDQVVEKILEAVRSR